MLQTHGETILIFYQATMSLDHTKQTRLRVSLVYLYPVRFSFYFAIERFHATIFAAVEVGPTRYTYCSPAIFSARLPFGRQL